MSVSSTSLGYGLETLIQFYLENDIETYYCASIADLVTRLLLSISINVKNMIKIYLNFS